MTKESKSFGRLLGQDKQSLLYGSGKKNFGGCAAKRHPRLKLYKISPQKRHWFGPPQQTVVSPSIGGKLSLL